MFIRQYIFKLNSLSRFYHLFPLICIFLFVCFFSTIYFYLHIFYSLNHYVVVFMLRFFFCLFFTILSSKNASEIFAGPSYFNFRIYQPNCESTQGRRFQVEEGTPSPLLSSSTIIWSHTSRPNECQTAIWLSNDRHRIQLAEPNYFLNTKDKLEEQNGWKMVAGGTEKLH